MRFLFTLLLICFVAPAHAKMAVVDGDTIRDGQQRYRLAGIDAPEKGQTCGGGADQWACGKAATERLKALIRGRDLRCVVSDTDRYGRQIATCRADGLDIAQVLVREGLAWAYLKYADTYRNVEIAARAEARGIWRRPSQPAWEFRAERWSSAATTAPEGCAIKGNISPRGRIYHTPWSPSYPRTKINTAKGERWFCDEAEALAAGWRAPR